MSSDLTRLEPGLSHVDELQPGKGWIAANLKLETALPLSFVIESGYKLNQDVSLYGDAYIQPTIGVYGADIGARIKSHLDFYAGGWMDVNKNIYSTETGIKFNF